MGIKFLCPNGHKLHVKASFGGKKALCPKCGAKVLVPQEVESPGTDSVEEVELVVGEPVAATAGAELQQATAQGQASAPPTSADPILESPEAVWYVRPATGGQFGPASGDIMRGWINEGRVGAGSLVWRAGWSEWRSAAATFPQLGGMLAAPAVAMPALPDVQAANGRARPVAPSIPMGQALQSAAVSTDASALDEKVSPITRKRRRQNDVTLLVSAVLAVIALILVIVLVLVIRRQSESNETPEAPKATAKPPSEAPKNKHVQ